MAPAMNPEDNSVVLEKAEQLAIDLIGQSEWELESSAKMSDGSEASLKKAACNQLRLMSRKQVTGDIYHYFFELRVGSHSLDKIGIHRVVKEQRHLRPIRTHKNILLQHGDAKNFQGMFLPGTLSPNMSDDFGLAIFLAANDVDVWGIDQAWALVPAEVTDFSFMKNWGLKKHVDDLRTAMAVAYYVRILTGSGNDQINLLGFSSGVWTCYALLNTETQLAPRHRLAKGLIAADGTYKTDSEALKNSFYVNEYNRTKALLDKGEYGDFVPFATIAELARTDPNGDSPLIPGFNNMQAAMFFGAGPILGEVTFHYFAGRWENELPVDLQYVTKDEYFDFMAAGVPWEAAKFINEYCGLTSGLLDLPVDDHLGEITVPILNLSPAGGFGELSKYTTTLLGSTDITHVIPSLHPPEEAVMDLGHVDLFMANKAPTLVWQPILDWILGH